ncbi:MAG: Holliday junction branch migration protein RuvA [Gemmatimonadaceae bacterium]|nr:Holliday junction branch migration protein RuvA [Gemmatimonadaceae bacterium]
MLTIVTGTLLAKDLDHVEVMTAGGVGYELAIPLATYEKLPRVGEKVTLHTHLVVREDEWLLYGFHATFDRRVFRKLLGATGVGPALALGMLSALSSERVVKALREKDVTTLTMVPRVGRKKAEQMILDLAEKLNEVAASTDGGPSRPEGAAADDAIRALVSLGYAAPDAEKAVRKALEALDRPTAPQVIRAALVHVGRK